MIAHGYQKCVATLINNASRYVARASPTVPHSSTRALPMKSPCSRTPPPLLPLILITNSNFSIRPIWNSNELINNAATPARPFPFFTLSLFLFLFLPFRWFWIGRPRCRIIYLYNWQSFASIFPGSTFPGRKILHNKFLPLIGARCFTRDKILLDFRFVWKEYTILIRVLIGKPLKTITLKK